MSLGVTGAGLGLAHLKWAGEAVSTLGLSPLGRSVDIDSVFFFVSCCCWTDLES